MKLQDIKMSYNLIVSAVKNSIHPMVRQYEQAVELQAILSDLLKPNEFTVLILNPVSELTSVREIN